MLLKLFKFWEVRLERVLESGLSLHPKIGLYVRTREIGYDNSYKHYVIEIWGGLHTIPLQSKQQTSISITSDAYCDLLTYNVDWTFYNIIRERDVLVDSKRDQKLDNWKKQNIRILPATRKQTNLDRSSENQYQ